MLLQKLIKRALASLRGLVQKILAFFHQAEFVARIVLEKCILNVFLDGTHSLLVIRVNPNQELLSVYGHCVTVLRIYVVEYDAKTLKFRVNVEIELD